MFLFFYVFNFNAIARDNCYVQYKGLDTNKRSHLIIPENRSTNSSERYFECGVGNQLFCNDGQLVAVRGKAKIGTIGVENQFVKCAKTESGYEWVRQESFKICTENDVKSINGLNKHEVLFKDMENAEMIYVKKSMGLYSGQEFVFPIDDTEELCFAYMCKPDFVLYDDKCTYKSDVPGRAISETNTGSTNTGASQSDVGETNKNPSPDFVQAMSELEEINKALDEVMKRLQEEKQVKNDNVA